MTAIIALALLALLWSAAAVFWLLDSPSPRQTVELLLASAPTADEAAIAA